MPRNLKTATTYTAKEMWEDRGIDGVITEAERV
jgi:hypothetical protein